MLLASTRQSSQICLLCPVVMWLFAFDGTKMQPVLPHVAQHAMQNNSPSNRMPLYGDPAPPKINFAPSRTGTSTCGAECERTWV